MGTREVAALALSDAMQLHNERVGAAIIRASDLRQALEDAERDLAAKQQAFAAFKVGIESHLPRRADPKGKARG
jgi:hypothetical protein